MKFYAIEKEALDFCKKHNEPFAVVDVDMYLTDTSVTGVRQLIANPIGRDGKLLLDKNGDTCTSYVVDLDELNASADSFAIVDGGIMAFSDATERATFDAQD